MMKNILALAALALLMSCHQSSESNSDYIKEESLVSMAVGDMMEMEPPRSSEPIPPPSVHLTSQNQATNRQVIAAKVSKAQKIIKTGSVTVDVDDLRAAKSALDLKIQSLNGYYESENYSDGSYNLEYHLTIRVPTEGFEQLISSLDNDFGRIVSKAINAQDVTEEYVDLGIRLESKLAALTAYRQFLKRATNVEEILNVQREIRQIEEEIEAKKGRLRYLDDQAAYSTLRITLSEDRPIIAKADSRHFGQQISNAFISGYDGILNFIIAIAYVWPLWIALGLIAFFWKRQRQAKVIRN